MSSSSQNSGKDEFHSQLNSQSSIIHEESIYEAGVSLAMTTKLKNTTRYYLDQ